MTSAFLPATPAEQTRMSIWPISPAAARVARSTAFGSVTLTSSDRAELPPTSATAAFRRAGSWSQIVTRPPSAAIRFATPSPMPDAPPVTTAVIPSNRLASDTFKPPDANLGPSSPRKQRLAAVHPKNLPADIFASGPSEKGDRVGHLVRLPITDKRLDRRIHLFRIDDPRRLEARSLGRAWTHRIDANALGPDRRREAARIVDDGGLERCIDDAVRDSELRRGRADVDHRSASRLHHRRHESLTDEDRAIEVVLGQRPDVFERNAERVVRVGLAARRADVAAGAIDENVDPPELGFDLFLHLRDRRLVADVAAHGRYSSAMPAKHLGDSVEIGRLAILCGPSPGQVMDRDVRAKLSQTIRHYAPEPSARAGDERDLAGKLFGHPSVSVLRPEANRAHVVGAAADHRQFVICDSRIVAALPGRAKVGVVREAVDSRGGEAGGERRRRLGGVEAPPFRPQKSHVPRFEPPRLEHRIQLPALRRDDIQHRGHGDGAVADGAAHEAIAFVGKLHPVVLQMHVPHVRSDAADEIERRLGDWEGVASIETDADAAGRLAKLAKFFAAEVLVILDRQNAAFVGRTRAAVGERGANLSDELFPLVAKRVTIAAQNGRQSVANDLGVEKASRAQRALERTHHQPGADDGRHAEAGETVAERTEFVVAERPEPGVVDLENLRAELGRDGDEAFETRALGVRARTAGPLQAQMIGQPIGVEAEGKCLSARRRVRRLHRVVHRSPASTMIDCLVTMRLSSAPRNNAIRAMSSPSSVALMD